MDDDSGDSEEDEGEEEEKEKGCQGSRSGATVLRDYVRMIMIMTI